QPFNKTSGFLTLYNHETGEVQENQTSFLTTTTSWCDQCEENFQKIDNDAKSALFGKKSPSTKELPPIKDFNNNASDIKKLKNFSREIFIRDFLFQVDKWKEDQKYQVIKEQQNELLNLLTNFSLDKIYIGNQIDLNGKAYAYHGHVSPFGRAYKGFRHTKIIFFTSFFGLFFIIFINNKEGIKFEDIDSSTFQDNIIDKLEDIENIESFYIKCLLNFKERTKVFKNLSLRERIKIKIKGFIPSI
ncbi:MAG: hypothetical protein OEY33_03255, partial [Bdellovibrionales bacterium]|nr:hypothetical protein [Bdellovibrionales bacterium]